MRRRAILLALVSSLALASCGGGEPIETDSEALRELLDELDREAELAG